MEVRVLDCIDVYHRQMSLWYGNLLLHSAGRRHDVRTVVAREQFDVAVVQEDEDFVRTALITQSLREAGVGTIFVVTSDPGRRMMYRRCGAHRIVAAKSENEAWEIIAGYLPAVATA